MATTSPIRVICSYVEGVVLLDMRLAVLRESQDHGPVVDLTPSEARALAWELHAALERPTETGGWADPAVLRLDLGTPETCGVMVSGGWISDDGRDYRLSVDGATVRELRDAILDGTRPSLGGVVRQAIPDRSCQRGVGRAVAP